MGKNSPIKLTVGITEFLTVSEMSPGLFQSKQRDFLYITIIMKALWAWMNVGNDDSRKHWGKSPLHVPFPVQVSTAGKDSS